jgi:hypothetical protein
MWRRTPIWIPENTRFRPYSLGTLISFFIGRFIGRKLAKLRSH